MKLLGRAEDLPSAPLHSVERVVGEPAVAVAQGVREQQHLRAREPREDGAGQRDRRDPPRRLAQNRVGRDPDQHRDHDHVRHGPRDPHVDQRGADRRRQQRRQQRAIRGRPRAQNAEQKPQHRERQRQGREVRPSLHQVPRDVPLVLDVEPVRRPERGDVVLSVLLQLLRRGEMEVGPVGPEPSEAILDLPRVGSQVAHIRQDQDDQERDRPENDAAVAPVVAGVDHEQQQRRGHDDGLKGVVPVERQRPEQQGREDGLELSVAVPQVEVEEPDVGRGRQHQLEGDARVQEPAGKGGQDEHPDPPETEAEEVPQHEADGHHRRKDHQDLGGPRHEDRAAEELDREDLEVDADAQVEGGAVSKVGRETGARLVAEVVVHETTGLDGLDGLVAEEEDRKALQADEPGRQEDRQGQKEEREVLARRRAPALGLRLRLLGRWNGGR